MINNRFGSDFIDLLFRSLVNMKRYGILNVTFDIPKDTNFEGTLNLHPIQDAIPDKDYKFDANYSQKKRFKEMCPSAINVAKDLHIFFETPSKSTYAQQDHIYEKRTLS
jgi:hypothetical protein